MARTLQNDELRKEIIINIADYMIDEYKKYLNGDRKNLPSIREVARQPMFSISVATVSDYLNNRLKMLDCAKYEIIRDIMNNNRPTIKLEKIQKRVLEASKLLLEGNTISDIANRFQVDYFVIERDLKQRLPQIDGIEPEYISMINKKLMENSYNNLTQNKKK